MGSKRITPTEVVEITRLYKKYGTYSAVAKEIGRSASAVARYVKLAGTPKAAKQALKNAVENK